MAVRGVGVTVLSNGLGFALQLIATIILARLLLPSDFGVVTMVTTFSLLLTSFGLTGFTEAVVQRETINHRLASNLFWINIGIGVVLTLSLAGIGPTLARLFHDPHVVSVAIGMSASILPTNASVIHLALLKRAVRFSSVSMNAIVARVVSVVLSIILGVGGWGYWALVAAAVSQTVVICLGAWYQCHWLPGFPRRAPGTGELVRFAMNVYSHYILTYAGWNTDNLLVGWRFHAEALGFYKKAFDLFFLPATQLLMPVGGVAISALSKFSRDLVQFRRHFLSVLSVFAFVGMGMSAHLTLVGQDLIRLLLGPKWVESGRIFTFFGPGLGVMMLYGTHGWIHVAIGKADRWFRWGIVELTVTVMLFLLGLRWGPVGIAMAWSASFWILIVPGLWYAGKPIQLGVAPMLSVVWKYLAASAAAGAAAAFLIQHIPSVAALSGVFGAAFRIAVASVLFGAFYLILVIVLHRSPAPIYQVARLCRDVLPKSWFRKASTTVELSLPADGALEPAAASGEVHRS